MTSDSEDDLVRTGSGPSELSAGADGEAGKDLPPTKPFHRSAEGCGCLVASAILIVLLAPFLWYLADAIIVHPAPAVPSAALVPQLPASLVERCEVTDRGASGAER